MFEYAPLKFSNIKECKIRIENKRVDNELIVVGKFYDLYDVEASEDDFENRYLDIPFYVKEIKKSEHTSLDFMEWIEVFCEHYIKENKNETFEDKINKLDGEEREKALKRMTNMIFQSEDILRQLEDAKKNKNNPDYYNRKTDEEFERDLDFMRDHIEDDDE